MSWRIVLLGNTGATTGYTWSTPDITIDSSVTELYKYNISGVETGPFTISSVSGNIITVPSLSGIYGEDVIAISGPGSYGITSVAKTVAGTSVTVQPHAEECFVTLECLGLLPYLIDETEEIKYWGGGYKRNKRFRLAFKFTIKPFITKTTSYDEYNSSFYNNNAYWDLMKVLNSKIIKFYYIGTNFTRIIDNLVSKYTSLSSGNLIGPYNAIGTNINLELFSYSELNSSFDNNNDTMDLTLCSTEWFTFS